MKTICDRCTREICIDESNAVDAGEWKGAAICNDCYAELLAHDELDATDPPAAQERAATEE